MLAAGEKGTAKEQYRNAQKAAQLMVEVIKKATNWLLCMATVPRWAISFCKWKRLQTLFPLFPLMSAMP